MRKKQPGCENFSAKAPEKRLGITIFTAPKSEWMQHKYKWLPVAAALGAMIFWSFSFVWVKVAYLAYQPITVVLLRLVISVAILFLFTRLTGRLQRPVRKDLPVFVLLAFFEPFLYFMGESYGLKYVSSTVASVIVATIPLFTPMVAWYFYQERLSRMNLLGLLISFAGVSLVVLNRDFSFSASPLGIALEFIAVLSTIGYATVLKKLAHRYNTFSVIAWQNLIGAFMFLPFWLAVDLRQFLSTPFHPEAFRAIVLLAVFASTFAFIFFTYSIRTQGINRSNTFINIIPVFVAIFAYLILGDQLTLQKMAGIVVVIAGLFLAQLQRLRTR